MQQALSASASCFADQAATGRAPTKVEIEKTVRLMLVDNFENFLAG